MSPGGATGPTGPIAVDPDNHRLLAYADGTRAIGWRSRDPHGGAVYAGCAGGGGVPRAGSAPEPPITAMAGRARMGPV